ncbi:Integrase core domain containing protein, partial [Aphelenchoides avenae]
TRSASKSHGTSGFSDPPAEDDPPSPELGSGAPPSAPSLPDAKATADVGPSPRLRRFANRWIDKARHTLATKMNDAREAKEKAEEVEQKVKDLESVINQQKMFTTQSGLSLRLPTFSGRSDPLSFDDFLDDLYDYTNAMGYTKGQHCQIIPLALRGEAKLAYQGLDKAVQENWEDLVKALAKELAPGDTLFEQADLMHRKQGTNESVVDFAKSISRLVNRAFPSSAEFNGTKPHTEDYIEAQKIKYFINGLRPSLKEVLLREKHPKKLQEAMKRAIDEERLQETLRKDRMVSEATVAAVQAEQMARATKDKVEDLCERFDQVMFIRTPSDARQAQRVESLPQPPAQGPRGPLEFTRRPEFGQPHLSQRGGYVPRPNPFQWQPRESREGYQRDNGPRPNFTENDYRRPQRWGLFDRFRNQQGFQRRDEPQRFNRWGNGQGYNRDQYPPQRGRGGTPFNRDRGRASGSGSQRPYGGPPSRGRGGPIRRFVNAVLPILSILALQVVAAAGKQTAGPYQICPVNEVAHFMRIPVAHNCEIPEHDSAQNVTIELFVPRTAATTVTAYSCTNVSTSACARSVFGVITEAHTKPLQRKPTTAKRCAADVLKVVNETEEGWISDGKDSWRTDNHAAAPRSFWGESCNAVSNIVIQRGTVGTIDGYHTLSSLALSVNCSIMEGTCSTGQTMIIWTPPQPEALCQFESAGTYDALRTRGHILIDEVQLAFVISTNQTLTVEEIKCVPDNVIRLENGAFARIVEETSRDKRDALYDMYEAYTIKPRPLPPVPSSIVRKHPQVESVIIEEANGTEHVAYEDVRTKHIFSEPPHNAILLDSTIVPGTDRWHVMYPIGADGQPDITLRPRIFPLGRRYGVIFGYCETTKQVHTAYYLIGTGLVVETVPAGSIIVYNNGTQELVKTPPPGWTTCIGPVYPQQPSPLFLPPQRHHRQRGWPFSAPYRVIHKQRSSEEYEVGTDEWIVDYYQSIQGPIFEHPADLPHGSKITYPSNLTQMYIFWERGRFEMLRPEEFKTRNEARTQPGYVLSRQRRVVPKPLENPDKERADALAELEAFRKAEEEAKAAAERHNRHKVTTRRPATR